MGQMKRLYQILTELEEKVMEEMNVAIHHGDFELTQRLRNLYIAIMAADIEDDYEELDLDYMEDLFNDR